MDHFDQALKFIQAGRLDEARAATRLSRSRARMSASSLPALQPAGRLRPASCSLPRSCFMTCYLEIGSHLYTYLI
jgi:hypothetical protein